jgi:hypothetical protein
MRFKRFFLLYENLSITGAKITPEESISSAAVKNKKTGEIIEGDFHYDAQTTAWKNGWFPKSITDKFLNGIRELQDEKDGYKIINDILEDGFTTSKGRFLSRQDALKIARAARQINPRMRPDDDMMKQYSSGPKIKDIYLRSEELL